MLITTTWWSGDESCFISIPYVELLNMMLLLINGHFDKWNRVSQPVLVKLLCFDDEEEKSKKKTITTSLVNSNAARHGRILRFMLLYALNVVVFGMSSGIQHIEQKKPSSQDKVGANRDALQSNFLLSVCSWHKHEHMIYVVTCGTASNMRSCFPPYWRLGHGSCCCLDRIKSCVCCDLNSSLKKTEEFVHLYWYLIMCCVIMFYNLIYVYGVW